MHDELRGASLAGRGNNVRTRRVVELVAVGIVVLATVKVIWAQEVCYVEGSSAEFAENMGKAAKKEPLKAGTTARKVSSIATYDEIVAEARRCVAEEKCAVAGGVKGCRCPVAVRTSAKKRVDDAARNASCEQVERLYCPPLENPRCEKQLCIADQVRE